MNDNHKFFFEESGEMTVASIDCIVSIKRGGLYDAGGGRISLKKTDRQTLRYALECADNDCRRLISRYERLLFDLESWEQAHTERSVPDDDRDRKDVP